MKKPNILLITTDQQHWNTLGTINPSIKTPSLDRLANEGVRFERAYCSNPTCSPARASIITGMYPSNHNCWAIGVKLPEDVPTVGDIFMKNGYHTSLIGKAHFQPTVSAAGSESLECHPVLRDLDFWRKFHGPWYGFEHIELARNHADEHLVGQHYAIWLEEHGLKNWRDYFVSWPKKDEPLRKHAWDLPEKLHYTTWTGERTIAQIDKSPQEDKPFFIWSSFHDPHPPYLVSEPWDKMYNPKNVNPGKFTKGEFDKMPPHYAKTQKRNQDYSMYKEEHNIIGLKCHLIEEKELHKDLAVYYGMISFVDYQIGKILGSLEKSGQAENTIVIFTTDHGHFLGQHGLIDKGPFHYEDLLKIPMIVRYPGQVPEGKTSSALQSQVDFAPTFLNACGLEVPGYMQGVNQLDTWCGKTESSRDSVIVENRMHPTRMNLRTYINERYKITIYRGQDYGELFDLKEDPGELNNLWDNPASDGLKKTLLHKFVQSEIEKESVRMPRISGS